ncbi:MAG: DUF177 domain-containing protein [Bacilli bacterium]|nr:DUF177 domain-containing protein [Bacilli bacterium]
MQIDITLLTNINNRLDINKEVIIPKEMLTDSRIDNLKDVKLLGELFLNEENDIELTGNLKGIMILKDDITLEPVEYKFDTIIEETLTNNQNILDITDILWQNILVEIPSKVRKTNEDINLSGDGWRVLTEDEYNEERNKANNPFANLSELLNTKESE